MERPRVTFGLTRLIPERPPSQKLETGPFVTRLCVTSPRHRRAYPCETWRIFAPAVCLVDPLPAPAIASGPVGAQRTGRPLIVDPFLVRAANDPVHHRDRAHAKPLHVGQDLLGYSDILAHIARLGEPSLQLDSLFVLGQNNANG